MYIIQRITKFVEQTTLNPTTMNGRFSLSRLMILVAITLIGCSDDENIRAIHYDLSLDTTHSGEIIITNSDAETGFKLSLDGVADEEIKATLSLDDQTTKSGNMDKLYKPIPHEAITLSANELTIAAGESESPEVTIGIEAKALEPNESYRVRVNATLHNGITPTDGSTLTADIILRRESNRTIRQILFFEVNNCNPLNALEYRLEDGSQFFDAVVLFAANINYDAQNDKVYLSNNPNVQALLDGSESYLQPLREKGIKVYLGLLGNHDVAGLAQLSGWGAEMWAEEVAEACRKYRLDGVALDDEYSKAPDTSNKWFTNRSAYAGAKLAYELKSAMAEKCYWPTDVAIYEYGALYNLPSIVADGRTHTQSEFIDILIPDYGSSSQPYGDLGLENCCGISLEMNYGYRLTSDYATAIKESGYGWCMWFGFDPSGSGGVKSNLSYGMEQFEVAAEHFYSQKMAQPEVVYHKIGEGEFDPAPYPFN